MRGRLTLAYVGTGYAGWQRQSNALAVQQVLEEALERLFGAALRVTGAGRTDAGVHARGQVASFNLPRERTLHELVLGTNRHLPRDIRVLDARWVSATFDAQRDAVAKSYLYRLDRERVVEPVRAPFVVATPPPLDLARLRAAAHRILGEHDFAAFALAGGAAATSRRRIFAATWEEHGSELRFRVTGDGFLRGMVRSLVGTMLEVAAGKRSLESFAGLLSGAPRGAAGPTAPAHGLCLERVDFA